MEHRIVSIGSGQRAGKQTRYANDVEQERARWRQWCVALVCDALREFHPVGTYATSTDLALRAAITEWLDRREREAK